MIRDVPLGPPNQILQSESVGQNSSQPQQTGGQSVAHNAEIQLDQSAGQSSSQTGVESIGQNAEVQHAQPTQSRAQSGAISSSDSSLHEFFFFFFFAVPTFSLNRPQGTCL